MKKHHTPTSERVAIAEAVAKWLGIATVNTPPKTGAEMHRYRA